MNGTTSIAVMLALLVGLGYPAGIAAAPITYTEQAVATGSLGGTGFSDAAVALTFVGDTSNVFLDSGIWRNEIGTATVTVTGIGTATFTESMEVFDNGGAMAVGVANPSASALDTFNPLLSAYDLQSAIGPLSGQSFIRPDITFSTNLGGFNLQIAGDSTFTATTVPEPSSLAMASLAHSPWSPIAVGAEPQVREAGV